MKWHHFWPYFRVAVMPFLIGQMRIQLMPQQPWWWCRWWPHCCQLCTSPMVITREKILVAKSADERTKITQKVSFLGPYSQSWNPNSPTLQLRKWIHEWKFKWDIFWRFSNIVLRHLTFYWSFEDNARRALDSGPAALCKTPTCNRDTILVSWTHVCCKGNSRIIGRATHF